MSLEKISDRKNQGLLQNPAAVPFLFPLFLCSQPHQQYRQNAGTKQCKPELISAEAETAFFGRAIGMQSGVNILHRTLSNAFPALEAVAGNGHRAICRKLNIGWTGLRTAISSSNALRSVSVQRKKRKHRHQSEDSPHWAAKRSPSGSLRGFCCICPNSRAARWQLPARRWQAESENS